MRTRHSEVFAALGIIGFAFWAAVILRFFVGPEPGSLAETVAVLVPRLPSTSFRIANMIEAINVRIVGHASVLVWLFAVLGGGLSIDRALCGGRRTACATDDFLYGMGAGLLAAYLGWLGLGLTGLWFPAVAWISIASGVVLLFRERAAISRVRGPSSWLTLMLAGLLADTSLIAIVPVAALLAAWKNSGGGAWPGILAWPAVFAILGGFIALFVRSAIGLADMREDRSGIGAMVGLAAVAALGFLMLAAAVGTPEVFYDALVYHLALPSLFTMYHKVVGLPSLMHSWYPLGGHMLYGWLWSIGGQAAARIWRLWLFSSVILAVWRLAQREARAFDGVVAACLFATMPLLLLNSMHTSVDVEACFFLLLACMAARTNRTLHAAIFAGSALGVKPTAVFMLVPIMFFSPVASVFRRSEMSLTKPGIRRVALSCAVVTVLMLPWLGRNAVGIGNPVYPLATKWFKEGRQFSVERMDRYRKESATPLLRRLRDLPKLPWLLVRGKDNETFIGPLPLVCLPVIVLALFRTPGSPFAGYAGIAALSLVCWLSLTDVHRFLLPVWGLLCVLIAWSWREVAAKRKSVFSAGLWLFAVFSSANLAVIGELWRENFDPIEQLAGRESRRDFLARKMKNSYSETALQAGSFLRANNRVLMVGETRGLYWPVVFISHSIHDLPCYDEVIGRSRTSAEVAKRLRQSGVTHLFVNNPEVSRMVNRFDYHMLDFDSRESALNESFWPEWVDRCSGGDFSATQLFFLRPAARKPEERKPRLPMVFKEAELRGEYEGRTEMTWSGDTTVGAEKKTVLQDAAR